MRWEQGKKLADQIVEQISSFCDKITIAGSIRRKKPKVRDVDIVLIPKPLLWHRIISTLQRNMDAKVLKCGNKIAQLTIKGVNVDLYSATPETWGALILIRTGSMQSNIRLSTIALRKGMKLTHHGLMKNGEIIASTEKEVFEALDLSYVEPDERG